MANNLFNHISEPSRIAIASEGDINLANYVVDSMSNGDIPKGTVTLFGPFTVPVYQKAYDLKSTSINYNKIDFKLTKQSILDATFSSNIDILYVPFTGIEDLRNVVVSTFPYIGERKFIAVHRDENDIESIEKLSKSLKELSHSIVYNKDNFSYIKLKTQNKLKPIVKRDSSRTWD